jgi:hypothetical protein
MTKVQRVRGILRLDHSSTASVLGRAYAVINGMGADPIRFSAPVPPLPTLKGQTAKVELAEHVAATRVKGAAAARNVERQHLVQMLETERSYVQTLCDASPDQAVAILEAAGMVAAPTPVRNEPILKVTVGVQSGTVNLDANATVLAGRSGKKTCFNWQWTTDGGQTFDSAPVTPHARTTIANLAPLTMVGFRVSVTDIKGPGAWSQIVTILVQ